MSTLETSGGLLAALSDELAGAVEQAGRAVVAVDARRQIAASGIVWPDEGLVVTASHVIEREEGITVTLAGGEKVGARLAGRDPGSDLAVLRLTGGGAPPPADLAPAESVRVGHLVIALGRPGGEATMASFGVVSAVGGAWRTALGGQVDAYIRADVRLLPGFSGGPLIDTAGRVVGFNSWHLANGQDVAIPAHTVRSIVQTLLTHGRVRRAFLGVTSQPVQLPETLRQKLGVDQTAGLMILGIEPGSPAERGGLLQGDILLTVAGRAVADAEDLQAVLGPAAVGQATAVAIVRGGERAELTVTPGERP